jgi:hypothetical protein
MDGDGKPEYVKIAHNPGRLQIFYLVGGPGGRNAAGRITAIDNGHGAKTLVTYRSTKEIDSSLPFPEIVVTSTETVSTMGLGGSLASVNYAYGAAKMYFDPISDSFTTRGYETVVEVYGTGPEQQQASHGIVRLLNPLEPYSPGMSAAARFQRYQTAGRSNYTFFVGYDVPRDPWILLRSFDPWTDTRRLGSTRNFWRSRYLPVSPPSTNTIDCEDVPDAYQWTEQGTGLSLCQSRGFTYVSSSESWAGTQPPREASVTFNPATRSSASTITRTCSRSGTRTTGTSRTTMFAPRRSTPCRLQDRACSPPSSARRSRIADRVTIARSCAWIRGSTTGSRPALSARDA